MTEGSAQNIHVYPNPASELLTISCEGDFDYQLVDLSGRIVSSGSATDSEILNVSKAATGIYQLNVHTPLQKNSYAFGVSYFDSEVQRRLVKFVHQIHVGSTV